ncbi:MAG: FecR domain-containing protein [Candidatus Eremiobacteraeota bacterium]|nr:FecR domain-containing protein [Candidatus Eremiobacteraeota bacterium]MBV8204747.1 FecR domain-containing protein [Candidatus Eremiobacteraeota bacterium]MBV8262982.1 FecR domain-containing protein [Candidatus Eremiobacteraeota bacterium]MBV8339171.1 FecR domain-containing protein [Candidatus Eremiobacteraeota bacterium]MBV8459750.1 FecR domain-containing protein [Candidatus Eremiobacteraeota bacterium]
MECSEALDLLYESFDAQITPAQQSLLNGHRRTCFACAGTLAKAQRFQDLIHRVPQLSVPRGLEARIIERVLHTSPEGVTRHIKLARPSFSWRDMLRPAYALGGVMAAGLAVFFIAHGVLMNNFHRPADETITASVEGVLQAVAPNNQPREVAEADTPISTGEVLRPEGAQPAIVAITPHLALTLQTGAEVQVSRLHYDKATGAADAVFLKLRRGTLRINEILHRDVSPVHVATAQATFVPTGTTFSVTASTDTTNLAVTAGSVAVHMPGRSFSVLAGHGVRITQDAVIRETLTGGKHSKSHIK